jgi:hypothetical protein
MDAPADRGDKHQQHIILHGIDDPPIANANTVEVSRLGLQLETARRPVVRQADRRPLRSGRFSRRSAFNARSLCGVISTWYGM